MTGGYKAQEEYMYRHTGELYSYAKGYKTTKDADETIEQIYYFDLNQIRKYYQNYFNGGESNRTSASHVLYFSEEGCTRADMGYNETEEKETISR